MFFNRRMRLTAAAFCMISLTPGLAWAGKYGSFRAPSASTSIRTPSVVAPPRAAAPSAPTAAPASAYGSYRSERTPSVAPSPKRELTGSDRTISQETSGSALSEMRRQDAIARQQQDALARQRQEAARPDPSWIGRNGPTRAPDRTPPTTSASRQEAGGGMFSNPSWIGRTSSTGERTPPTSAPRWQRQPDWTVPPYAQPRQSYGDWNPLLMWALIASLNRPGASEFFHNHRDDPGYRQWRADADAQARTNADLRAKLDELDRKLAEKRNEPVDKGYVPAGIDPKVAHATQPASEGGSGLMIALFLILLLGGAATMGWIEWKKRQARPRTGLEPVTTLDTLKTFADTKINGPGAAPSRFKVGQVITIERTPFIMAGDSKIVRPETRDGTTSLVRIGRLDGAGGLTRLYVDDVNFLQVAQASDGTIGDCRYFSRIDEEYPQSADEWRVWLDPRSGWSDLECGILADPKFRTPDDALYDRVWSPGEARVPPRAFTETVEDLGARREIAITAQLYARPMPGAEDRREYLLVEVREEGPKASVILYAGIDLPATSIGL